MPDERIQLDNGMGGFHAIGDRYCENFGTDSRRAKLVDTFSETVDMMRAIAEMEPALKAMLCGIMNRDLRSTGYFYQLNHSGEIDRVYYASDRDREHIKMLYGLD